MSERVEMNCPALPPIYPFTEGGYPRLLQDITEQNKSVTLPASSELRIQPFTLPEIPSGSFNYLEVTSEQFEHTLGIQRSKILMNGVDLPRVMKDPCFLKNGHIIAFGTQGDSDVDNLGLLTASSPDLANEVTYRGVASPEFKDEADRSEFCAPGAVYDPESGLIVVAAQTLCFKEGGRIELLTTPDGESLTHEGTIFQAEPGTDKAVIYDAHLFTWDGEVCASVNMGPKLRDSAIYVARSNGNWRNGWQVADKPALRKGMAGCFLGKEWNDEGSCIGQFNRKEKDGDVNSVAVMLSVGFLAEGEFGSTADYGTAQRIVLSAAETPWEEFSVMRRPLLDPALEPDDHVTEVGHPAWITDENGKVYVDEAGRTYFTYQGRNNIDYRWRYYLGSIPEENLIALASAVIAGNEAMPVQYLPQTYATLAAD